MQIREHRFDLNREAEAFTMALQEYGDPARIESVDSHYDPVGDDFVVTVRLR